MSTNSSPNHGALAVEKRIRALLAEIGLESAESHLKVDDDLYDAGMTSHASVRLMLSIEEAFDVEFPDEMLQRESFATVAAIRDGVGKLSAHVHS